MISRRRMGICVRTFMYTDICFMDAPWFVLYLHLLSYQVASARGNSAHRSSFSNGSCPQCCRFRCGSGGRAISGRQGCRPAICSDFRTKMTARLSERMPPCKAPRLSPIPQTKKSGFGRCAREWCCPRSSLALAQPALVGRRPRHLSWTLPIPRKS